MNLAFISVLEPAADGTLEDVRSTVSFNPERETPPTYPHAPQFNEQRQDGDTEGGLNTRDVSQFQATDSGPSTITTQLDEGRGFEVINRQVASSGYAAGQEAAGRWGHERLHVQVGIEPTLNEGQAFDDKYFAAAQKYVPSEKGNWLEAGVPDMESRAAVNAAAKERMRLAYEEAGAPIDWNAVLSAKM